MKRPDTEVRRKSAANKFFYFAEAVSGAYWPQKGVMAAKEEDIREDIPERIKAELVLSNI